MSPQAPPPAYNPNVPMAQPLSTPDPYVPMAQPVYANHMSQQIVMEEEYCGPVTCATGLICILCIGPLGVLVACCPCDKRTVVVQGVALDQTFC
eukprot:767243-Hanusia_phi.AAC.13